MARETDVLGQVRDVYRDNSGNVISSRAVSQKELDSEQAAFSIVIKLVTILASIAGVVYGLYLIVSKYDALEYIAVGLYWLLFLITIIPKVAAIFLFKAIRFMSKICTLIFTLIILIYFANELYGESVIMVGGYFIWGTEETIFETYYIESFIVLMASAFVYAISASCLED